MNLTGTFLPQWLGNIAGCNTRNWQVAGLAFSLLFFGLPQSALGQSCTFTIGNLNFGSVDLGSGTAFQTTSTLTANCTGTPGAQIRLCPSFDAGTGGVAAGGSPRYLLNGGVQLQYNIYRNAAFTNVWGSRFWGHPPNPPQPRLTLDGAGNGTRTRPVRAQIFAGQTGLTPGTYSSSFAGAQTTVAYDYNSVGNCGAIGLNNAVQVPFTVSANNIASCSVSASTLDFGTTSLISANIDTSANVAINCPTGMAYTVGLNNGGTGSGPASRLMVLAAEDIQYGIYRDAARSLAWGNTIGTNTVAGTGTGAVQNITAFGRVPAQTTPSPGTYTDTVVVTITY